MGITIEQYQCEIAVLERQLADAREMRDLAIKRHQGACEQIERIAPQARESEDRRIEIIFLYQRIFGLEERLQRAEAMALVRQDQNALLTLVQEWAKYQYYPGREALPTTEAFTTWYRRGVTLTEQLCRVGGVEPPKRDEE